MLIYTNMHVFIRKHVCISVDMLYTRNFQQKNKNFSKGFFQPFNNKQITMMSMNFFLLIQDYFHRGNN